MNRIASKNIRAGFIPLVLLSILILIPQGATSSLVVCLESDGHVNVEAAHQGVCYPKSNNQSPETPYLPLSEESPLIQAHYAACIDIAISFSEREQYIIPEQGFNKLINALHYAFIVSLQSMSKANSSEEFSVFSPPLNNSIISSLSSTILLI